jgi:membrane-associated phospholipid phosphatase
VIKGIKPAGILLFLTILTDFVFPFSSNASDDIEFAGDVIVVILPVTAGAIALNKNDQEGALQFSKSFLTALGVTAALKYSIDAERPNGGSHSFPSGHTSLAFSSASFLQKRYGWDYGIPAYIAASFVGWSRIESDNHYFRDVLAGAAIGVVSTYIFTDAYQKGIAVTPFVEKRAYGLVLNATF